MKLLVKSFITEVIYLKNVNLMNVPMKGTLIKKGKSLRLHKADSIFKRS